MKINNKYGIEHIRFSEPEKEQWQRAVTWSHKLYYTKPQIYTRSHMVML
jgi:hypothetical protein